jgi:hypothetical protein
MSYYKSLGYAAKVFCGGCNSQQDLEVEDAWWEGDDLHLLHDDGTKIVVPNAQDRGFEREIIRKESTSD